MKKNDWKKREGVVYSTNGEYQYQQAPSDEGDTPISSKQQLRITLDRTGRAGKQVTIVSGFMGKSADREALCKLLKNKCGTGGSVKDLQILIQGDKRDQLIQILQQLGYKAR